MPQTLTTSLCPVTGDVRVARGPGPAVLAVRGIWAPRTHLQELFDLLPATDMAICDLPGTWDLGPANCDAATFSRAFDEVIGQLFPDRPVVALGVSTGALVTLGLRSTQVRAQVLVEPFLTTSDVWPLIENIQSRLAVSRQKAASEGYTRQLLGIGADEVEGRDFTPLLDALTVPVTAVVGSVRLGVARVVQAWPSLAGERTRTALAAHATVTEVGGAGHDVTGVPAGWAVVADALRQALAIAAADR